MKFKEMFSLKGGLTLIGLVFWFLVTPVMAESSGVFHTVVFWLKPSTPEKQVEKIIESIQRFEALPMVEKVIVGKPIMSDRAVVDDSFSIAFTPIGNPNNNDNSPPTVGQNILGVVLDGIGVVFKGLLRLT